METKRKALGRGLEQLFNNEVLDFESFEKGIVESANENDIKEINLDELRSNPYQPRKKFDEKSLDELASSIKEHGIFQPIIVKKSIKGYEIVAGERRYKASKIAGLKTIPAIIRDFSPTEMMEIALLENLQRENLTAIEEAWAYKNLLEKLNLTQEELGTRIGKSRSHITNMIGLLELPASVQNLILENKITMGHARVLSKLADAETIKELSKKIINQKLSVREVEEMAMDQKKKNVISKSQPSTKYKYIEEIFEDKLGTKVRINSKNINISFSTEKDLNRILEILDIKVED